ncbi:C-type lectin domain family 10 member A-like isoform X2 [Danio rerio]
MMRPNGYWRDKKCNLICPFVCESTGKPVLVNNTQLTWRNAQRYCREHYIDLFTVRSEEENQLLHNMSEMYTCTWIGLFRDSWKWSDHSADPVSLRWATGQPDNALGNENCAVVDKNGLLADKPCSEPFRFICSIRSRQNVLRLELKAEDDVNVELMMAALLEEIEQNLGESMKSANVKLTWRKQANGKVFQTN